MITGVLFSSDITSIQESQTSLIVEKTNTALFALSLLRPEKSHYSCCNWTWLTQRYFSERLLMSKKQLHTPFSMKHSCFLFLSPGPSFSMKMKIVSFSFNLPGRTTEFQQLKTVCVVLTLNLWLSGASSED